LSMLHALSMPHVCFHAACKFKCCMSMSILHIRVQAAYPCLWSMAVSMLHVYVHVACLCACVCCMYIYMEMLECWTVRHSVSPVREWTELTMPGQVRYRTKLTQSCIVLVRYRTKILDAGMPMPALVSSMPMPSYAVDPSNENAPRWICSMDPDMQHGHGHSA
jgi:hypothetical protein